MPGAVQPSRSDVHVNRPLTNISVAFMQKPDAFVADRVFPVVPVAKQSDRYFTYDRNYWWRDEMAKRAPSTESAGATYKVDNTPSYSCDTWALHRDIDDQVRANADSPLALDREATEFLALKALISKEVSWASAYFTTGKWTTDYAGVSGAPGASQVRQWNDYTNSDPLLDVRNLKTVVQQLTGYRPNKLVLGRQVFDVLMEHPDIIGRFDRGQTSGPAIATRATLAALMELDEVLVMDGIKNTSNEENATQTKAFIGGKAALLVYAPPNPGIMIPSGGYTFSWTGLYGANALGGRVKTYRMEHLESDRVELELAYTHKLIAADLGAFLTTLVA